ncbi:hypothetical protein [Geothermobacter hydrogeniphilus]|nr:hypothetical protein [Geothermobacter hydrogeniphilus]
MIKIESMITCEKLDTKRIFKNWNQEGRETTKERGQTGGSVMTVPAP